MIVYSSLATTSLVDLHRAFLKAFSDYQVPIDLPFLKFENMLLRRGYAADLSLGAFLGNELVGFVLNGQRLWNASNTLYDCGTGVVPDYRRQGITTNLFKITRDLLREKEIEQYLLEVIQTNTSAVNLYNKQGFELIRSLSCYRLDRQDFKVYTHDYKVKVEDLNLIDWDTLRSFWDIQPSWQNSIDSVMAVPQSFQLVTANCRGQIVGYGLIDRQSADIAQMAVHKEYRRKGIGTALIEKLFQSTVSTQVFITNVDDGGEGFIAFLSGIGFQNVVNQFEMKLFTKNAKKTWYKADRMEMRGNGIKKNQPVH